MTPIVLPLDNPEYDDALNNKYAWITNQSWERLHYVRGYTGETWDFLTSSDWTDEKRRVMAYCGRRFLADLPGIFSRMGMSRCADCCDRLGIPRGDGSPVNDKNLENLRGK